METTKLASMETMYFNKNMISMKEKMNEILAETNVEVEFMIVEKFEMGHVFKNW